MQKKRVQRTDIIRDYIHKILENQEIDYDEEWWGETAAKEELEKLAHTDSNYVTDSDQMKMEGNEKLIFAVFQKDPQSLLNMVREKVSSLARTPSVSGLQLVLFTKNMRDRTVLDETFTKNVLEQMRTNARRISGNKKLLVRHTYILDQVYIKQTITLKNLKRHEMMQMPPIRSGINLETSESDAAGNSSALNALVLTVDLFQLAELYNLVGDRLFKNNVRFGINETLDVDQAIRETLEKHPEEFWFKNNGVTILVENPDFKPRSVEELLLDQIEPDREPRFSVINGAQTISTAARYFFKLEHQTNDHTLFANEREHADKQLKKSRTAQVLLRIIHIAPSEASGQAPHSRKMAKEISVALNRQKPIKIEDIAFTTPFAEKMADYLKRGYASGAVSFQLVRRGEGDSLHPWMDLVQFARTRMACLGSPGPARTQGAKTFLKLRMESEEPAFERTEIFTEDWRNADQSQESFLFRRDYGSIWFAHQTARAYDKIRRSISNESPDALTIIRNGKWYFTAFLVNIMNGFSTYHSSNNKDMPDFSDFNYTADDVFLKLPEAIRCFADMLLLYIESSTKYKEINSNLFKGNDLYKDFIKELRSGHISCSMQEKLQTFADLFDLTLPWEGSDAPSTLPVISGHYMLLNQKKLTFESVAQAMLDTVSHILTNYTPEDDVLKETCSGWLTDDPANIAEGFGYFRSLKSITVNGKIYWVGTSSSTRTKCRQIRQLCKIAEVPANEIFWFIDSPDEPVLSW